MVLELADGTGFEGVGFGAKGKSAGGECVFQTGKLAFYTLRAKGREGEHGERKRKQREGGKGRASRARTS